MTRREFLLVGAAGGAVAAVGVIIPLTRSSTGDSTLVGPDGSTTTTATLPPPAALVGLFPKLRVASVGDLGTDDPITFEYPLQGQHNVLVKLGTQVATGVGPDNDIVAFSSLCTHMGCLVENYQPEYRALGPCPCHFSTFDLSANGQASLGQATENLPQVLLSVEGDDIHATGVVRLIYGHTNTLQGAPMVEV
jgi:arsenite oxidase small subunit